MTQIFFCENCGEYTMKHVCFCGRNTISHLPQKYSPGKLLEYRIKARRQILEEKYLL